MEVRAIRARLWSKHGYADSAVGCLALHPSGAYRQRWTKPVRQLSLVNGTLTA